jgi:hypothetical protein
MVFEEFSLISWALTLRLHFFLSRGLTPRGPVANIRPTPRGHGPHGKRLEGFELSATVFDNWIMMTSIQLSS